MTDAEHLIYPGMINALNGAPGGGKTWVALHTCAEAIKQGLHVLFIDLEGNPASIVGRLQALECSREDILERFHYVRPGSAMTIDSWDVLERNIREWDVALVVIDSIGELLALQGIRSSNDDDEVAKLYRLIPRRIADLGPAVLLLDHVPKATGDGPQMWAIGSQRKKAAIDGAAYMVETVKAFAKGVPGKVVLRTAKDREGNFVVGAVAAEIDLTPGTAGGLTIDVRAPQMSEDGTHTRRTHFMGQVTTWLAEHTTDAAAGRNEIQRGTGIHDRYLTSVLGDLVAEGWLNKFPGAGTRKADRYCLVKRFDELETPPNHMANDGTF